MADDNPTGADDQFIVWAETAKHPKPLIQIGIPFARLIDDIVVPYQTDESFFVDGAPVKPSDLLRIKILRVLEGFSNDWALFNRGLHHGEVQTRKMLGEQYYVRVEAIIRQKTEDVTSQVIKAYNKVIKPRLSDYVPKREELIQLASTVFVEGMKLLGSR